MGWCLRHFPYLTVPDPDASPIYSYKSYGVPLEFLRIIDEVCLEQRTTTTEFYPLPLALDIAIFAILGAGWYYSSRLLKRRQQES